MSLITILIDDEEDLQSENPPGPTGGSIQSEDFLNISLENNDGLILTEEPLG